MTSPKTEYKSKITVDTGLTRGRVPCRLLKMMGARPGDYLIFRPTNKGEAVIRMSRPRKKSGTSRKASGGKRR